MLLYFYFLLAGCFCHSSADILYMTVLQNMVATLPCPHGIKGDVTWSRYINGDLVTLVTIKNGAETKTDNRYGSLADNSLVITNATSFDATMYLCNRKQIYLEVTADPKMVVPSAGGDGLKGSSADTENQSHLWKIPVGVVVGAAALVLLGVLILTFCSRNRNTNSDKTVSEVIYEEIEAAEEQPGREPYFESPYCWATISETPRTSTPPNNNLYSTVDKKTAKGRSREECVYSLAQNPTQTGDGCEQHAASKRADCC